MKSLFSQHLRGGAWGLCLLLAMLAGAPALAQESARPMDPQGAISGVPWLSFSEALAAAEKSGKVVLVDVYADWCGWCRKMQEETYSDAEVKAYLAEHFEVARLNTEEAEISHAYLDTTFTEQRLAAGFGATGTPTLVFLESDGSYLTTVPGFQAKEAFMPILEFLGTRVYKEQSFQEFTGEAGPTSEAPPAAEAQAPAEQPKQYETNTSPDGPVWQTFTEAMTKAQANGKIVLVDIYAPWCGWCRKMQHEVYTQDNIKQHLGDYFEVARLNIDDDETMHAFRDTTLSEMILSYSLGAEGTPTTVFLGADGTYITRLPGYANTEQFDKVLRFIGTEAYKEQSFQEFQEAAAAGESR